MDGAALGIDGVSALQRDGVLATDLAQFDPKCQDGEIGCGVSHANVLRDIVARGWTSALILEDDVELAGNEATWRDRAAAAFRDLDPAWELWYLYRCFDIEHRVTRITSRTVVPWTPQCGLAYAVSARGARILLDALTPLGTAVDRVYMDVVKSRAIKAFAASPQLVTTAALPSLINRDNPGKAWVEDGINRPPEYWPERYLTHLGESIPIQRLSLSRRISDAIMALFSGRDSR